MIVIHVMGTPRPQPRGRHVDGRVVSTGNKLAKLWRSAVVIAAKRHRPVWLRGEALNVSTTFYFPTADAARWGQPHTHKPDRDNLDKLILDCLKEAKLFSDDCIVADGTIRKRWAKAGGCVIEIAPCESTQDEPPLPAALTA